jgi:transposase
VLSGERADDPLYLPAMARVRAAVGRAGLLYVGDGKMAALDTRAGIAAGGDGYLCPLPAGQVPSASLDQWLAAVERGAQPLETVERPRADEQVVPIAEGYEWTERRTATVDGTPVGWPERWLLVRSLAHARAAEAGLRDRLAKAQTALAGLAARAARAARSSRGRPVPGSSLVATHQAAAAIRTQYQVADLLQVTCAEQLATHTVPLGAGRQATVCDPHAPPVVQLTVTVDQAALEATVRRLGWRVYVTNQPVAQLSLAQAVLAYRDEYLVERSLGRLKGQPLSLTPMYLARDDHATGLVRLLAIALRVLTLLEGVVRRQLAQPDEVPLVGLTAGNPTRATRRPTAERLLAAFEDLTLTVLRTPAAVVRHLTPLSPLQHRILTLLGCPPDLYTGLTAAHGAQPP